MSFLGFANYYREFIKCYADKVYPMQQYNMIIEHRTRDKHQKADSLSMKTEF